jgi:hypothetical protein
MITSPQENNIAPKTVMKMAGEIIFTKESTTIIIPTRR